MTLSTQSAVEFPFEVLCETINSAFKGYVGGEITFTPPMFANYIMREDVNLSRSLIALADGQPAALSFHARRGATTRIAMFGVVNGLQEQGIGKYLMGEVMREARERGDRGIVLEVFEQNPRAVRLYEGCGFNVVRRLMGYSGENLTGEATELQPVDIVEAARKITAWQPDDLVWDLTGETLVKYGPPAAAYRMGDCYTIVSSPEAERMSIFGLAVPPQQQRKGKATRLVSALLAAHPGKTWTIGQVVPEEYGAIFTRNGLKPLPLNQFQMALTL
jgi:ribosomal protein S18 acetylase RimI-like enzyme